MNFRQYQKRILNKSLTNKKQLLRINLNLFDRKARKVIFKNCFSFNDKFKTNNDSNIKFNFRKNIIYEFDF